MTDFTIRFRNEREIVKIMQQEIMDDVLKIFPDTEVKDRDDLKTWYDGYKIGREKSIYNPYSVMKALQRGSCRSYWTTSSVCWLESTCMSIPQSSSTTCI